MDDDRKKAIEARAYQLWEETGHPHGMHDEHWHQAEREVDEAASKTATDQAGDKDVGDKPTDNITSLSRNDADAREDIPKRRSGKG